MLHRRLFESELKRRLTLRTSAQLWKSNVQDAQAESAVWVSGLRIVRRKDSDAGAAYGAPARFDGAETVVKAESLKPRRERNTGANAGSTRGRCLSEVSEVRVDVVLRATQARFECSYKRVLADLHQTR